MNEHQDDDQWDFIEERRETLQRRRYWLSFGLVLSVVPGLLGSSVLNYPGLSSSTVLLVGGLIFPVLTVQNAFALSQLPKIEPDEFERIITVERAADAFLSTVFLMAIASFVVVVAEFPAAVLVAAFFVISMASLRFPVARVGPQRGR